MRVRTSHTLVVALSTLLFLLSCSSNNSAHPSVESVRYGTADLDTYTSKREYTEEIEQRYSEEEIGIDSLVDNYIIDHHIPTLAHFRTYEAALAEIQEWDSQSPLWRDRFFFELRAAWQLITADEARPAEVEKAIITLRDAFYQSLDICVESSQWPEIKLYSELQDGYIPVTKDELTSYQDRYGMTLDEFLDFRHECHKYAATYPALNSVHRDELIKIRRDYYTESLREWILANPETVVPIDYENSINHPYVDYLRLACLEEEDPEECARSEGITLE